MYSYKSINSLIYLYINISIFFYFLFFSSICRHSNFFCLQSCVYHWVEDFSRYLTTYCSFCRAFFLLHACSFIQFLFCFVYFNRFNYMHVYISFFFLFSFIFLSVFLFFFFIFLLSFLFNFVFNL